MSPFNPCIQYSVCSEVEFRAAAPSRLKKPKECGCVYRLMAAQRVLLRPHLTHPPQALTMASASQQQRGRDRALSALDGDIQTLNIAKDSCGIPPAQAAFGSTGALLTTIRVRFPHATINFQLTSI